MKGTYSVYTYRESRELLSASSAKQTEEEQQRADAHPVAVINSPNYARTKIHYVSLVALANHKNDLWKKAIMYKFHSSPCRKMSELERGCWFISLRRLGSVWDTVRVDTLLILAVR